MEDKKKDLTIYDLAQELKVSPSTVSRALNNHDSIGNKTKEAVQKLAKKRGYRPNVLASSLRTNRSNTIGIMVSWINRPFISSLIAGIEAEAREGGYQVIITQSSDSTACEVENLKALYDSRISALVVSMAMQTTDYEHFDLFKENDIPVVFVDRIPRLKGGDQVQINNFKAAYTATEHLIEQGCRRVAHFGGARHQQIYEDRRMGYLAALKNNGLEVDDQLVLEAESLSAEEGYRLTASLMELKNPPDAIFCANDSAAVSIIQYAKKHGIRVPEDLAVIGFNNDPVCEIIDPALSSIHHPAVEMGKRAVQRVLNLLNGTTSEADDRRLILDTHLVVRASSNRKGTASPAKEA